MPAPRITTHEYLRLPETVAPAGARLRAGTRSARTSADAPVGRSEMYIEFCAHTDTTGAGHVWLSPIDVVLDRDRALVVQPDVIVVMNDRRHIVTDRVWGAPDLVIEVLSPHPRIGHLEERLEWFAQYGVRECWTVLQGVRQIEVIFVCERPDRAPANVAPPECIRSEVLPTLDVTPGEIMPSG